MFNILKVDAVTQKRVCAICSDEIPEGKGIQRGKQWFCSPWHAQQCRPKPPWWKRIFSGDSGASGGCC